MVICSAPSDVPVLLLLGSLSTRVFETRTATGREHFACLDRIVSQIFILLVSNGEKKNSLSKFKKGLKLHFCTPNLVTEIELIIYIDLFTYLFVPKLFFV